MSPSTLSHQCLNEPDDTVRACESTADKQKETVSILHGGPEICACPRHASLLTLSDNFADLVTPLHFEHTVRQNVSLTAAQREQAASTPVSEARQSATKQPPSAYCTLLCTLYLLREDVASCWLLDDAAGAASTDAMPD